MSLSEKYRMATTTAKMAILLKKLITRLATCPKEKDSYGEWQKVLHQHQYSSKQELAEVGVNTFIPGLCPDCQAYIKELESKLHYGKQ